MKVKKILRWMRRDFVAIFVCEHCGAEDEEWGYDDFDFYCEWLPAEPCKKCKKKAVRAPHPGEVGLKYAPWEVV